MQTLQTQGPASWTQCIGEQTLLFPHTFVRAFAQCMSRMLHSEYASHNAVHAPPLLLLLPPPPLLPPPCASNAEQRAH